MAGSVHARNGRGLEQRLAHGGLPARHRTVRLADLASDEAAFVTSGIAPVGRVADLPLPANPELMRTVTQAHESVP